MAVIVRCPSCQAKLRIEERTLGRKIRCAKCREVFVARVEEPPADVVVGCARREWAVRQSRARERGGAGTCAFVWIHDQQ